MLAGHDHACCLHIAAMQAAGKAQVSQQGRRLMSHALRQGLIGLLCADTMSNSWCFLHNCLSDEDGLVARP